MQKPNHLGALGQGKQVRFSSKFQQGSDITQFTFDSLCLLGGKQAKVGEGDKCEKSKLYLESFVLFQARDDAGLDWHDTDRPVRSV